MKTDKSTIESLPVFISIKHCDILGLSPYQFRQMLTIPNIPVVTIGNKQYLIKEKFFEWINTQRINL